jgi:hypothetical protein
VSFLASINSHHLQIDAKQTCILPTRLIRKSINTNIADVSTTEWQQGTVILVVFISICNMKEEKDGGYGSSVKFDKVLVIVKGN